MYAYIKIVPIYHSRTDIISVSRDRSYMISIYFWIYEISQSRTLSNVAFFPNPLYHLLNQNTLWKYLALYREIEKNFDRKGR